MTSDMAEPLHLKNPLSEPADLLHASGEGEMHCYSLFPGISLSKNRFFKERIELAHTPHADVLEVNYCHAGRIGWDMQDGISVYLGPGDLDVHTMDACSKSKLRLPLGYYEGITVIIDLKKLETAAPPLLSGAEINADTLLQKLCPSRQALSLSANADIDRIFSVLYQPLPEKLLLPQYRLAALELLLYLWRLEPADSYRLAPCRSEQAKIIREIHALLVSDLTKRYTIEELSRAYLMNSSTLKSVFKTVYSASIGSYMKEYRIRRAMELLRGTDADISDVARRVGYESQGKFSAAFRDVAGMLPTAYRKKLREPSANLF